MDEDTDYGHVRVGGRRQRPAILVAPKKEMDKTQSDRAIEGEEEDNGSKMEKPKADEKPETSDAFKKWIAAQPKVPSMKEAQENEKAEEEARKPVSKNDEAMAQKLLTGSE